MILVTGGTGLVGAHLLFRLANTESNIRAIYRSADRIELTKKVFSYYSNTHEALFSKIEWMAADITDIESLKPVFQGVTHVYHCAAFISFDPNDIKTLQNINVEGTCNMVNLSLVNEVEKFGYISSIAALGSNQSKEVDENTEWGATDASGYSITKHEAEMEVWRASQEGLKVVIVNPGVIVGPGFWHSGSGLFFKSIAKGLRRYLPGGSGFTSVNDVVNAITILIKSEIQNKNYIIVSENWSYKTFMTEVSKSLNKKPPKNMISLKTLQILRRLDWISNKLTGRKRKLSKASVASFYNQAHYNNSKISEVSGFEFENLNEAISLAAKHYLDEFG